MNAPNSQCFGIKAITDDLICLCFEGDQPVFVYSISENRVHLHTKTIVYRFFLFFFCVLFCFVGIYMRLEIYLLHVICLHKHTHTHTIK